MRKLMYHIVEFEREKSMAALRIELKAERQKLYDEGRMRPLTYRARTEQQALHGDQAALSQLRGWAYRQNRKTGRRRLQTALFSVLQLMIRL